MFHKQKDGFQASWVLAIHVRWVRWGMRAGFGPEGGGSYVTETTAGTASQWFPEEFWEHQGPTCEHETERETEAWGGNICQQLQRRINPIVSVRYAEKRRGHDVNSTSWSKLPSPPPPPSLSPPGFNKTSRAQLTQASQLMLEGGGAPCGTHSAKGSSGRRILRAGFTLPNKTHTHTHTHIQGK